MHCKGYSYNPNNDSCNIYTVSSCPIGTSCIKTDEGVDGELFQVQGTNESGCYIRKQSTVFLIIHPLICYYLVFSDMYYINGNIICICDDHVKFTSNH